MQGNVEFSGKPHADDDKERVVYCNPRSDFTEKGIEIYKKKHGCIIVYREL